MMPVQYFYFCNITLFVGGFYVYFLRDCRQITFVMLDRFCLLSKPHPHSHVLNGQYHQNKMDRIPTKIKWYIHSHFTLYFKFWRHVLRFVRWSHQIFYLLLLLLAAFTSVDIIFHKFFELHSILSVKKIFVKKFLIMDSLKLPIPLLMVKIH